MWPDLCHSSRSWQPTVLYYYSLNYGIAASVEIPKLWANLNTTKPLAHAPSLRRIRSLPWRFSLNSMCARLASQKLHILAVCTKNSSILWRIIIAANSFSRNSLPFTSSSYRKKREESFQSSSVMVRVRWWRDEFHFSGMLELRTFNTPFTCHLLPRWSSICSSER